MVLFPEPFTVPGFIIQLPVGKPLSTTLPDCTSQVGWVIVPVVGAAGVGGCALITTLAEAEEVQLPLFTVKL